LAGFRRLDEGDAMESRVAGGSRTQNLAEKIAALRAARDRHRSLLAELERTDESQISLTDPDGRAMASHTRVAVGYNVQLAVDAKYKLIVEQEVTNQVVDMGLLKETAEQARAILGVERIDVVADRGCFKIEDIVACDEAGLTPHVPKPRQGRGCAVASSTRMSSAATRRNVFTCPSGQILEPHHYGRLRDLQRVGYSNPAACPACPLRARCTTNVRRVSRLENEAVLDRMSERLRARPELIDRRRETVEHPFGSIKQWMNQSAFLMRDLDNVRGEFSLTALVYNLRRALNLVGVETMTAAVRG
jgi:hypothetical protein